MHRGWGALFSSLCISFVQGKRNEIGNSEPPFLSGINKKKCEMLYEDIKSNTKDLEDHLSAKPRGIIKKISFSERIAELMEKSASKPFDMGTDLLPCCEYKMGSRSVTVSSLFGDIIREKNRANEKKEKFF